MSNKKLHSHSHHDHGISRRDVLKQMGIAIGSAALRNPVQMLIGAVASNFAQRAAAEEVGRAYRKYIYMQSHGAPPRWMFDLFLTPYGTENFTSNPMVGTRYRAVNGRYVSPEYATYSYQGLNLPWMWQFNLPAVGGGVRPMTDLLNHMLVIQGIRLEVEGHPRASMLRFQPFGSAMTLGGLASDIGRSKLPAVECNSKFFAYQSLQNNSVISMMPTGNLIDQLFGSFNQQASAGFASRRMQVNEAVNQAVSVLNKFASTDHPGASSVGRSIAAANDLINLSLGDLQSAWTGLYNKYSELIQRALQTKNLPGISDLPVGATVGSRAVNPYNLNFGTVGGMDDLRGMFTPATSQIEMMAENFALAEFAMTRGLVDFMSLGNMNIVNINRNGQNIYQQPDEHGTGSMPSLLINTMHFLAYSACLVEFIDQLKAANVFNDTVLEVGSEFGRAPRASEANSEHGGNASSSSLFCGAIQGPHVIGNIVGNSTFADIFPGSWGEGAPIDGRSNEVVTIEHVSNSIATMMKQPTNPFGASQASLVMEQNGVIVPAISRTRQV